MPNTRKSTKESRRGPQGFAALVLRFRQNRNLSRPEAARILAVPYRTIQDWELGLHAPRGLALQLITSKLTKTPRRR